MISIQVKRDGPREKWKRLSAKLHPACPMDTVQSACRDHLAQYVVDNQLNPHTVAVRAVDHLGTVIFLRESNATANRPILP